MSKTQLVAVKATRYAGQSIAAGETFEATAKDARLLRAIGKAKDVPIEPVTEVASTQAAPVPEAAAKAQPEQKEPKQKRTYQRRDMVAKSK